MNPWHRTGVNYQAAREARRLSRAALAARCGLVEEDLAAIERGESEPGAGAVIKLEDTLGMPRGSSFRGVRWDDRNLTFVIDPQDRH
jgi:transcriptional regulator with XRE-family HTH domain